MCWIDVSFWLSAVEQFQNHSFVCWILRIEVGVFSPIQILGVLSDGDR
jgi:hypothetical protein